MSKTIEASGGCLCGAVRFTASEAKKSFGACHCSMCRRWSGGPLLAIDCGNSLELTGADNIAAYRSSDWADRCFCRICGSNLFYRIRESNEMIVPLGLFDDQEQFTFVSQIFIEDKPSCYDFANETKTMTGEEAFALYAPKD
jgi:hypothetical protein